MIFDEVRSIHTADVVERLLEEDRRKWLRMYGASMSDTIRLS